MSLDRVAGLCKLRKTCAAGLLGAIAVVGICRAADDKPPAHADLPLGRVVMFNAGVGFFEHEGQVTGDAAIELKFNTKDVNDLLKSMVLQDLGGGQISTINYGSKDPITKTLKTFAVDLTENPTLGSILQQLRGEEVQVDGPEAITGTIVGVENRQRPAGKDQPPLQMEILNLLAKDGLRSVPLELVGKIRLTNEKLDGEFRQALTVLALGHATDKKSVTLNFRGQGPRSVRVGYVQETPIWKTSYRLVLDEKAPPFLQGWAIVENTTESDWNNIQLTLISGRPISFVMDLYQPLYVQRPLVEPELFASLRPQTYGQDLAASDAEFFAKRTAGGMQGESRKLALRRLDDKAGAAAAESYEALGGEAKARYALAAPAATRGFDASQGVKSVAQTADVGELFQYQIATPVSLPRQQSAMLPIVNESIKGEKVSIYNASVQAKHPLSGLRLTNATDLHLMQGPITVFDGGVYAGDARIEDLPPGTTRLVSYALDLDTEVAPESKSHPEQLLTVRLTKGVLFAERKYARAVGYTIKNSGKRAKQVLVEYPLEANWKLKAPAEPAEKTRDLYRFAVAAQPGKPANLKVEEEQIAKTELAIANLDDGAIAVYLNAKVVGDKVKAALADVVRRRAALAQLAAKRQQIEQQVATIGQEQDRIRQNMPQLDRTTDLYKRYVKKFGDQEDQIERLRGQIADLQTQEAKARQDLDAFLLALDVA